jgi:hypothetical protein
VCVGCAEDVDRSLLATDLESFGTSLSNPAVYAQLNLEPLTEVADRELCEIPLSTVGIILPSHEDIICHRETGDEFVSLSSSILVLVLSSHASFHFKSNQSRARRAADERELHACVLARPAAGARMHGRS